MGVFIVSKVILSVVTMWSVSSGLWQAFALSVVVENMSETKIIENLILLVTAFYLFVIFMNHMGSKCYM